uniref:Uncharacterized protein n=1 Tax=Cyprinus carpio TaxID=7962 RepID=A0A8C1T456_CYPCA
MPLLNKKNIKGRLEHAKIHLDRPVDFLWSDVTQLEPFGPMHQWYKNTISIAKHGGELVLLWGCFTIAGTNSFAWLCHISCDFVCSWPCDSVPQLSI